MIADVSMSLLVTTAPIFIFCLMFGFLRQMFNNWLQSLFSSCLTVLFASLIIRFCMDFQGEILSQIQKTANDSNLWTMGAMGLLVGILASALVYFSAKIAITLAGAGVEGTVQGAALVGIGASVLGAKKLTNTVKSGAGKLGNTAAENRELMWNNATPGNKSSGGGVAERRKASLENAKRNAA